MKQRLLKLRKVKRIKRKHVTAENYLLVIQFIALRGIFF